MNELKECYCEMADEVQGGASLLKLDTLLLHVEEQVFFSVTYIIESGVT
jgi:hypothetical protein